MKVLHVYKTAKPFTFGGVEEFIEQLSKLIYQKGHRSDVFTISKCNSEKKIKKIKIFSSKKIFEIASCPFSFSAITFFYKLQKNYDLINYHFPWPFMDILSFFSKKPYIITYHSDIIKQKLLLLVYLPILILFFWRAKKIVCTSRNYFHSSKLLFFFSKKVEIIPLGLKDFSKKKIKKHKLPFKFFFLFIGNNRHYKSLDILLRSMVLLNTNLIVVGKDNYKQHKNLIKELKISDKLHFLENISDDYKYYLIKKTLGVISCSTSRAEAFGISLLEGLMFNKNLISTKLNTGTTFVNINNLTGYCINPNSISDLIKALKKIIHRPDYFKNNMYIRFKKYFEIDKISENYIKTYKKIIKL
jgi:rhamnosyl/mannosyltransferase